MSGLSVAILIGGTAFLSVSVGVFSAYCAMAALLNAINPSRPSAMLAAFAPQQSQASGD